MLADGVYEIAQLSVGKRRVMQSKYAEVFDGQLRHISEAEATERARGHGRR